MTIHKAVFIIIIAGCIAYSNSFTGEFIFDDLPSIVDNPSIKKLSNITDVLHPPFGLGVAGRPFINLTLAVNYAVSGEHTWSYHVLNLVVHILAALTFFGIIRRTLVWEKFKKKYDDVSIELALVCALIWMVHPIQTQSVTYIIQRCESIMGLFFLLTLYCAVRGWEAQSAVYANINSSKNDKNVTVWHSLALLCFLIGIGTKEVIVAAPIIIFIYDMIFREKKHLPDNFRSSPYLYRGLILGLILLTAHVLMGGQRSTFGDVPHTWYQYAVTQSQVIIHYLKLSVYPVNLCLDYSWQIAAFREAFPYILSIVILISFSIWLLFKRHPLGFPILWFFLILAPTSSIMPLPDLAFEYHMYLPLAGPVVFIIFSGYEIRNRMILKFNLSNDSTIRNTFRIGTHVLITVIILWLGVLTFLRNGDYQTKISIWSDTVAKQPQNSRAHHNLGHALGVAGRHNEAIPHFYESIRIDPESNESYIDLGTALRMSGRLNEAVKLYEETLKISPRNITAHIGIGLAYSEMDRVDEAFVHFQSAIQINPDDADANFHIGVLLMKKGNPDEAVLYFQKVFQIRQNYPHIHSNLGAALAMTGKIEAAIAHFQKALAINPEDVNALSNMGLALAEVGKSEEAIQYFQKVLTIKKDYPIPQEFLNLMK